MHSIKYTWRQILSITSIGIVIVCVCLLFVGMTEVAKATEHQLRGMLYTNSWVELTITATASDGKVYYANVGPGVYTFFKTNPLPDGIYTLHHNKDCPSNTPITINIPALNNQGPDISIQCPTYPLIGYVTEKGIPITRTYRVYVQYPNTSFIEAELYEGGRYEFSGGRALLAGVYSLRVYVEQCTTEPVTISVTIPAPNNRGPDFDINCTLTPTPTNTPASPYDLGFRPNLNGYQFNNQALFPTGSTLWSMFEQFFGRDNVRKADGSKCQAAVSFSKNEYLNAAGGWSCFGYSITSISSYLKISQPNAGSFAIPHFDRLYDQPQSIQLTNPIAYYSRVSLSRDYGSDWQTQIDTCRTNSNGPIERIKQGIQNRQPLIVNLNVKWNSYWHALLPYRVEEVSSNEAYIYVYDSESKGEERQIHFQRSGNDWRWTYTFVGSLATAGTPQDTNCEDIYLYSVEAALRRGEPPVNFCERSTGVSTIVASDTVAKTGRMLVNLPPDGDWIVRDSNGRRLGWLNDQLVSEISNAYAIPYPLGSEPLAFRSLYLPEAEYFVEVNNSSNLAAHSTIWGDGRMLEITKQLRSASSISRIQLNSSLEHVIHYDLQNLDALTLHFDYELSTASRLATMDGINISSSEDLDTEFDGERLKISRAGGSLQYHVTFEQMGGQYLIFLSDSISLGVNETHILNPTNWENLSNVVLEIDRGRDGTIEEKRTLENRAEYIYLPVIQQDLTP